MKFGEKLSEIRSREGLTTRDVEELSGVSNSYISQIETGKRDIPHPDILRKLAVPLNVTYEYLMELAGYLEGIKANDSPRKIEIDQYKQKNAELTEIIRLLVKNM